MKPPFSFRITPGYLAIAIFEGLSVLLLSSVISAQVASLDVASVQNATSLSSYVRYARLPQGRELAASQVLAEDFQPLPGGEISFGYTTDQFWFLLDAYNSSNEAVELVLDTNVKFMEPLIIYEVLAGSELLELLRGDEFQPFSSRPLPTPKLTLPLSWQPGESKQLLFYVRSGSGVDMTLQLGTEQWVEDKYAGNRLFFALLTGILGTLILVNLFHYYAVRRLAHLLYAMQELAILLFMLHMDGLAFQYLWPESPTWNAHATMVFGHLVNLMALLFAISFLELKVRAPRLYHILGSIAAVAFIMLMATPVAEPQFSDQVGLAVSGLGGLLLFGTGIYIAAKGYRPARYFVAGWFFMSLGSFLYGLANLAIFTSSIAPILFLRVGVLAEALLLSYGLSDQLKTLNETAQQTQQKLLESTRERLADAQERIRLEQARHDAEQELHRNNLDIARARHDIRQPIYSLRLALLASSGGKSTSAANEVINRSLDHMEQLLLEESERGSLQQQGSSFRTYGELLKQLESEFEEEARNRGIELRIVDSKLDIAVPLVPLKRVVSNLVANAIRHSQGKRVLVGLRRKVGALEIMVLDNGIGLSGAESVNKGDGLGMGIVNALCEDYGWALELTSTEGHGTCFRLGLPA
jgi:signal transduction histidine kinase